MEMSDFAEKVFDRFTDEITDMVFLMIETDRELMADYLDLIHENGRHKVNPYLGKKIKERFDLTIKPGVREDEPDSVLIQSYQEFQ